MIEWYYGRTSRETHIYSNYRLLPKPTDTFTKAVYDRNQKKIKTILQG